jgi:1-acyl-sn-glycerol-3-phosphate acyltransferase
MTPTFSPTFFRFFSRYARWYVGRSFHTVRLSGAGFPKVENTTGPIVSYLNHASWWDPMIAVILAGHFWPDRAHFAAIDADALEKYKFFRRLGFFGVEKNSARGAREFLRATEEILAQPDAILWLTPQGEFADPRRRPVELLPGLRHLARRHPHATFLPLAIEYPFWQERFPEALCRFGPPVLEPAEGSLSSALQSCQDSLAAEAISQDQTTFQSILGGRAGVSPVYDAWRRARALATGKPFSAEHGGPTA